MIIWKKSVSDTKARKDMQGLRIKVIQHFRRGKKQLVLYCFVADLDKLQA